MASVLAPARKWRKLRLALASMGLLMPLVRGGVVIGLVSHFSAAWKTCILTYIRASPDPPQSCPSKHRRPAQAQSWMRRRVRWVPMWADKEHAEKMGEPLSGDGAGRI